MLAIGGWAAQTPHVTEGWAYSCPFGGLGTTGHRRHGGLNRSPITC